MLPSPRRPASAGDPLPAVGTSAVKTGAGSSEVPPPADRRSAATLAFTRIPVQGRMACYGVAGSGVPVVLLHGWALGHQSYRETVRPLVAMGCRVFIPALPGFGGTAGLPGDQVDLAGFAGWADCFCDAVGIDEPAVVIGHSFGGGVAIRLAHDAPTRVGSLVLVNALGGALDDGRRGRAAPGDPTVLPRSRSMAERPLWAWPLRFAADALPLHRGVIRALPALVEDAVSNAMRNPMALVRVAWLARQVDLTAESKVLRARGLPMTAVHGVGDGVIPRSSFDALCSAVGVDGTIVDGAHSWPVGDADGFASVMEPVIAAAHVSRRTRRSIA